MFELLFFLGLVAVTAVIGAALRDIHDDDPTRSAAYTPPASHPDDVFVPHHR
ncbi:hypothetical protein [Nocardioides coralli]|uniref:hypothetical protein n=1 Tax=Nocardioides coralli TaxID=2872154 RepID=UPI001CA3DE15|nr:hypothetical protein [Nocardioides coralli]QZY27892.1 hypothetical protein K6T13_10295 [Nocardioides coralli]